MFTSACGSDKEIIHERMVEWMKSTTSAMECMELFGAGDENVGDDGVGG